MDRWRWACTPKHVDSVSRSVHTRVHVSVSVAVGRLAAQRESGRLLPLGRLGGLCLKHPSLSPRIPAGRVSSPGREGVGAQFPRPPREEGTSVLGQEPLEGTCSLLRADSPHLSSLQIFRRADKNGEFSSRAGP